MSRRRGFTLIEIMLALSIFSFIGIATVKQITQIVSTKNIALRDLDLFNALRSVVSVFRQDLSQSFHISVLELPKESKEAFQRGQQVARTLFDGRKDQLVFTSLSHRNYYKNRKETDQAEISYFLQPRKGREFPTLMKRESAMIDDDVYQGGSVYMLLDDVKSMTLNYWDEKAGKWLDDWNSDSGATRDRFPLAVKLSLVVLDRDKTEIPVETVFKVAFSNNTPVVTNY